MEVGLNQIIWRWRICVNNLLSAGQGHWISSDLDRIRSGRRVNPALAKIRYYVADYLKTSVCHATARCLVQHSIEIYLSIELDRSGESLVGLTAAFIVASDAGKMPRRP